MVQWAHQAYGCGNAAFEAATSALDDSERALAMRWLVILEQEKQAHEAERREIERAAEQEKARWRSA